MQGDSSRAARRGRTPAEQQRLRARGRTIPATSAIRTRSTAPPPAAPRSTCRPRSVKSRSRAPRPTGARSRKPRPGEESDQDEARSEAESQEADDGEEAGRLPRVGRRRVTAASRAPQRRLGRRVQVAHLQGVSVRPPRRGRVHRHLQVVRALAHPARAEHGPARGDGVDDPGAVGDRQVGLHQAHGRPALSRPGRLAWSTASRFPTCPTTTCSTCARSSACCSRTAPCSAR